MEKSKLISIRMEPETLKKIDAYCATRSYWNRSRFINHLLQVVLELSDHGTMYTLMEKWGLYADGFSIKVIREKEKL